MDDTQPKLAGLWFAIALTFLAASVVALSRAVYDDRTGVVEDGKAAWLDRPVLLAVPLVMVLVSLAVPQSINGPASLLSSVSLFATRLATVPEGMSRGVGLFRVLALVLLALTFESARAWLA